MKKTFTFLIILVIGLVSTARTVRQPLWAQCGGSTWTGATTCVDGAYCKFVNANYSQCVPKP